MAAIQEALNTAATETDLFAVVLPFVLVFALVYGLLMKLDLFDGKSEPVNAVISLVAALYVAANPIVTSMAPQFTQAFGAVGVALVVVLLGLIGAGLMGVKPGEGSGRIWGGLGAVMALGIVGLAAVYYGLGAAIVPGGLPAVSLPTVPAVDAVTAGVVLVAAGGVLYPITSGRNSE